MKRIILIFTFLLLCWNGFGQQLFYQDLFYGGVTGGGGSSGSNNGAANGQIIININPTSTIRKAYLFCNRYETTQPVNVNFNSNSYTFDLGNQIGANYFIVATGSIDSSAIHAIDVTGDINPTQNSYNINYPSQPNTGGAFNKYGAFYLLVLYENLTLPKVAVSVILNDKNATQNVSYLINNLFPINNNNPVGLAIHSDIIWDTIQDGSNIYVNGNNIGLIGGSDAINSTSIGGGVKGHFYYENNNLFGLDDDTPDSLMAATDGLADIKSYVNNGDSSFNVDLIKQPTAPYNVYLAFFLAYTTPCDTFTTTITANDTICFGESLPLQATGGLTYSWYGAFGGLSDTTIANPIATPTQTTTYICTITNDSGCVKTEQVKIWVNPLPIPDTLIVTNNVCGDSIGGLTVGNIPNGTAPFNYQLTNLQTLITQNSLLNTFSNLGTGNYEITITDSNGCQFTDTASITETNNSQANFTANPQNGVAPLSVDFTNTSTGANNFSWSITNQQGDTIEQVSLCTGNAISCGTSYTFESSGTYQVCLIVFNNIPNCADTVCQTIIVEDEIGLFIPNLFTPNGDGANDAFVISITGTSLIESLKAEVFNRWGMLIASKEFLNDSQALNTNNQELTVWDGRTTAGAELPESTYYYIVTYTKKTGETIVEKSSLTLLR